MPVTLKPWDEVLHEGGGDTSGVWGEISKPETHIYHRKVITMMTEDWPEGDDEDAWENWLRNTFVDEATSKHKVFGAVPYSLLQDWKLAVYETVKRDQDPVLCYVAQPTPETRKVYDSVAEWLDAQHIRRNGKICTEGFALVARRPSEAFNWFYAGLHGSDIYADSLKRKSRWIDSSGKVVLADMSTVDSEGNKKSEEKKEIK